MNKIYTGSSPEVLGFKANNYKIGTKKLGKDNKLWIIKKVGTTNRWAPVLVIRREKKDVEEKKQKISLKQQQIIKTQQGLTYIDVRRILGSTNVEKTKFEKDPLYRGRLKYQANEKLKKTKGARDITRLSSIKKKKDKNPKQQQVEEKKVKTKIKSIQESKRRTLGKKFKGIIFIKNEDIKYKKIQGLCKRGGIKALNSFMDKLSLIERTQYISIINKIYKKLYTIVYYIMNTKKFESIIKISKVSIDGFIYNIMNLSLDRIIKITQNPTSELIKHAKYYKKGIIPKTSSCAFSKFILSKKYNDKKRKK